MGSHLHVLFRFLCTHLHVFRCALTTLMQSYKRTPNIFTLVQKVKISYVNFFLFFKINQGFAEAMKVISFQKDLYVLRGRSPSKGTII